MSEVIAALVLSLAFSPVWAQKSCEELKTEIAAKLEAKGITGAQLDVLATEAVKEQKVVGSCEAGKKKLTYKKG